MSSALHTIIRKDLIEILENLRPEDEVRIVHLLLSNTSLDTKIKEVQNQSFQSNKGSPQRGNISGFLLTYTWKIVFNVHVTSLT